MKSEIKSEDTPTKENTVEKLYEILSYYTGLVNEEMEFLIGDNPELTTIEEDDEIHIRFDKGCYIHEIYSNNINRLRDIIELFIDDIKISKSLYDKNYNWNNYYTTLLENDMLKFHPMHIRCYYTIYDVDSSNNLHYGHIEHIKEYLSKKNLGVYGIFYSISQSFNSSVDIVFNIQIDNEDIKKFNQIIVDYLIYKTHTKESNNIITKYQKFLEKRVSIKPISEEESEYGISYNGGVVGEHYFYSIIDDFGKKQGEIEWGYVDDKTVELISISVIYRDNGIGSKAFNKFEESLSGIDKIILMNTKKSKKYWTKMGFITDSKYGMNYMSKDIRKQNIIDVFHGTDESHANYLLSNGYTPKGIKTIGSNLGKSGLLYVSSGYDDARWFANEKGSDIVLKIEEVPVDSLSPDPEDESGFTMSELLDRVRNSKMPAKFIITKPIDKNKFKKC